MSSYAEFLREAKELSATNDEERTVPVPVPHSCRRGTWSEWMKEVKIPSDALDSLVRRYGSTSWSATGGRSSSSAPKDGGVCARPVAGAWRKKPVLSQVPRARREEPKGGGATTMRGVSGATRARRSGRARALRLRSESFLDDQWPLEQSGRCSLGRTVSRPGDAKAVARLGGGKQQPQLPAQGSPFIPPTADAESDWPPVGALHYCGRGPMEADGHGGQKTVGGENLKSGDNEERKGQCARQEEEDVEVLGYEADSGESDFQSALESLQSEGSKEASCEDTPEDETPSPANGEERGEPCDGEWSEESEEEGEEDVVRMKCGCTFDMLDSHSCCPNGEPQSCSLSMCGGRAGPELPPWADYDHTLVLSNIPLSVTEEELEEDILMFGEVTNCAIQSILNEAELHTAYVRMKEKESCQWVISCYDGMPYGDGALKPMVCYMLPPDSLSS